VKTTILAMSTTIRVDRLLAKTKIFGELQPVDFLESLQEFFLIMIIVRQFDNVFLVLAYQSGCIGISKMKFRYNHRGFGGLWAIPQGVTAEECDEEEHSGASEGR